MNSKPIIKVGRIHVSNAVNIERPTPLGNPFILNVHGDRDEVCDKYEEWFKEQLATQNPKFLNALRDLYLQAKRDGYLTLGCYCAPKRCHGDTIKKFLDSHFETQESNDAQHS